MSFDVEHRALDVNLDLFRGDAVDEVQLGYEVMAEDEYATPPKDGVYPFDSFFSPIRSNCSSDTAESCLNSSVASLCFERSSSVRTLGGA